MENVIYRATICPARESEDGDTPDLLELCEENNAIILWRTSFGLCISDAEALVAHFNPNNRDKAIEFAVGLAAHLKAEREALLAAEKESS
jgi:hypothetical protein